MGATELGETGRAGARQYTRAMVRSGTAHEVMCRGSILLLRGVSSHLSSPKLFPKLVPRLPGSGLQRSGLCRENSHRYHLVDATHELTGDTACVSADLPRAGPPGASPCARAGGGEGVRATQPQGRARRCAAVRLTSSAYPPADPGPNTGPTPTTHSPVTCRVAWRKMTTSLSPLPQRGGAVHGAAPHVPHPVPGQLGWAS